MTRTEGLLSDEDAVLAAVCYADVFDFALRRSELPTYLPMVAMEPDRIECVIADLVASGRLADDEDLVFLPDRPELAEMRAQRDQTSAEQWQQIRRHLPQLLDAPWVKAVLLTGSLAAGNPLPNSDVDLFLVLDHRRMWLGYLLVRLWARWPRKVEFCPNYCIADNASRLLFPNLFTAIEWSMAIPLKYGPELASMDRENQWYRVFLPNAAHPEEKLRDIPERRSMLMRTCDLILNSRLGGWLDRLELRRLSWRTGQRYLPVDSVYKPHPPARQSAIFAKFTKVLDRAGVAAPALRDHIDEQIALLVKHQRDWNREIVPKPVTAERAVSAKQ